MRASDFQIESQATRDSRLGSVLNSPVAGSWKTYGLFGEASANVGISTASNPVTYGFTGHMVDLESGLNRTEYRQYDPKTGRWLSQEPTGRDGPNLYHFVFNNPVRFTDPNGLETRGGGISVGGNLGGATGYLEGQIVQDDKGNAGIAVTVCGGAVSDVLGVSGAIVGSKGNSPTISDLEGYSSFGSAAVSIPGTPVSPTACGGVVNSDPNSKGKTYTTHSVSVGVSVASVSPVDYSAGRCYTKVIPLISGK